MFKLSKAQFNKLANIASDLGLIAIGSVVLPATLDKFDLIKILIGTVLSIVSLDNKFPVCKRLVC